MLHLPLTYLSLEEERKKDYCIDLQPLQALTQLAQLHIQARYEATAASTLASRA